MKKMSFTNSMQFFQFGKPAWALLFVWCCFGLQIVEAQVIKLVRGGDPAVMPVDVTAPFDSLANCYMLPDCDEAGPSGAAAVKSILFTDDGKNDGNYNDSNHRRDTVEICPANKWQFVKVVFTDFDLETKDTLLVFDGNKAATRLDPNPGPRIGLGSGTGVGVSKAFGGWVYASCDPKINPSGCLTFVLKTDSLNTKGAGWEAWVDCADRGISITAPTIPSIKLQCDSAAFGVITIDTVKVKGCGADDGKVIDSVFLRVFNQHGMACIDTCIGGDMTVTDTFAIGQYRAVWKLKSDTTKTAEKFFSIQAPALVCNDDIIVPLGSACMIVLTPDDILEQPCDTVTDTMYYNITITLGTGKKQKVLTTTGHNTGAAVKYPIITVADIKAAGLTVCNATATVRIERIYYGRTGTQSLATIPCNNGKQSLYCETTLSFTDEMKPWVDIKSAPDTLIACDTTGLAALLSAKGVDNCDDDVPVTFTVTFDETDPCFKDNGKPDTTKITVVFSAKDDCGNEGKAEKEIYLIRPDIHDTRFVAKTKNVQVECKDDATIPAPGVKIGIWKNNAFEVKDTVKLSTEKYICGYILTFEDEDIPSNDCGKKKFRYWYALDWCDATEGPKRIDTTFIENTDTKAPTFVDTISKGNLAAVDIELDHFSCTYDISKITKPKATDNCDDNPSVRLDRIVRIEDGNMTDWVILPNAWDTLNCDSFKLRWIAEDDCHEQLKNDTVYQIIVIKDVTKPSAVCTDALNVSLPNEWGARICVEDIDAGSYDACGIVKKEIRIKGKYSDPNEGWTECIDIGCEYVHPDLQIEMRVFDKNMTNYNICWLDIVVEDKVKPICNPLPDVTEDCDKYHNGELGESTDANDDGKMSDDEYLPLTGDLMDFYNAEFGKPKPLCEDNLKVSVCGDLEVTQEYQVLVWPCGELKAKRRYRAKDWSDNYSNWAVQTITINYKANWKVTFHPDWEGACGDAAPEEQITIVNGACDLLGYEVTEKQFEIPGDACFKIERTYHVINWCKYVAGDPATVIARVEDQHGFSDGIMITNEGNENLGYFTYIQVLKVHDDEAPVVTVHDPEPCITGIEFDALPYGEEDVTPGTAPYECDEPKTWTAEATDCSSKITWIGKLYNAATGALVKTVETNSLTYVVSNKDSYYAEFWAYDNCSNSAGERGADIKFWDCKKPTPYVLNGLAIEIMQTELAQVWAVDLNQNSFDNCTDQSKLDLRIWHASLGDAPTDDDGVKALGKSITLGCDYIGTQVINIYVIDEEGNWDFAVTYVIIQDNMGACQIVEPDNGNMVAGSIVNPNGENVELVNVSISGDAQKSVTTGADGQFIFQLTKGDNYTLTPEKDVNPLNGVSTFDLVLISKHILGITSFDSPYKYIAADINKSGSITAFDMVQLRQLILNITTKFPSNDSWRFVDASYNFTSANPAAENFGEFHNINNLSADMVMDFIGVKVGDVNGNALANSLLGADVRNTNGALSFDVADRFVEAGQTVTVDFKSADMKSIQGYQFTMNFTGLELAEVVEGVAKAANFNTNLAQRGVLTTSWNGEATGDDVLFSLTFKATASGLLSDLVSVSSDLTTAEAYTIAGELLDVNIEFTTAVTAVGFELSQNTPNPFKGKTVIGFNLPKAGTATLKVMDVQGKVLKSIQQEFAKGYNSVTIDAKELNATGVLYYQLESADQVATKKMIIIE